MSWWDAATRLGAGDGGSDCEAGSVACTTTSSQTLIQYLHQMGNTSNGQVQKANKKVLRKTKLMFVLILRKFASLHKVVSV